MTEASDPVAALADPALDPLFWPMSRTGVPSAWITHVPFAHWLVAAQRPRSIVELGTHNGVSYSAFCEAVQRLGLDCRCLAVDTWRGDEHAGHYGEEVFASLSAFHAQRYAGFSELLRSTFDDALGYVPDGSVDLLHIDGLHTYEAVRHDWKSWHPKLAPGAVVLFHDTNVRERGFGVWRLYDELAAEHPNFEFLHGHGLGLVAPQPGPVIAALAALDGAGTAALRERFAILGERWRGTIVADMIRQHATGLQYRLDETTTALEAARTEAAEATAGLHHAQAAAAETGRALEAATGAHGEADRERARQAAELRNVHQELTAFRNSAAVQDEAYRQSAEHIATLETLLAQARHDHDRATAAAVRAEAALATTRASRSWRVTAPVRTIGRALGRRGRHQAPAPAAAPQPDPDPHPGSAWPPESSPAPQPSTDPRLLPVDLVICVHDALDSVRACLDSVLRCTLPPYRVILVDDGSGPETAAFLATQARLQGFALLRHPTALGYTRAANAGLAAATSDWVLLLNSDTLVTPGWLDRLRAHAAADPRLGAIGPLSNTASWQSVPRVFTADGDWAANHGGDPDGLARIVAAQGLGAVPLPFLNGFCLMLRRTALADTGPFDAATFGAGYGEENDLAIRLRAAGWGLAVATDAYVHHAQSTSYGTRRAELSRRADGLLIAKHDPATHIWPQAAQCRDSLPLAAMRARTEAALAPRPERRFEGSRLAFILPIAERGGGGNVVLQEGRALLRMGVDVTVLTLDAAQAALGAIAEQVGMTVRGFPSSEALTAHLIAEADRYDAVLATLYRTVYWLPPRSTDRPAFRAGYYVQDYEPLFFADDPAERQAALASYTHHPGLVLVTKTPWNQAQVREHTGHEPILLGPSVDTAAFAPAATRPDGDPIRITAMVRPSTPRRAPTRTVAVLDQVHAALGDRVALHVFGADPADLLRAGLHRPHLHAEGRLDQPGLAALLARTDILLDASDYQAMGLTALEAMLSGAAVIGPVAGGMDAFVTTGENGILLDTTDEAACTAAILGLVQDPARLLALRTAGLATANRHGPEHAAARLLAALFDA